MNVKKNTLWNLFGSSVPMLIGIVAVPYIYYNIGIERVGILTIIWGLIGYFSIFDFGLGRAITQRISGLPQMHVEHAERQEILIASTGVYLTLILGFCGAIFGFLAIKFFGISWLNYSTLFKAEIDLSFFLACLAVPATTTTAGLRGVLEGKQRFKEINLLKIALGLSNFLSPIASILLFGPRLDCIVGSLLITRYIILIYHYVLVKEKIIFSKIFIKFDELKGLLNFGGWMTLSNLISPLMVVADRFIIASMLGAAVVAYYTIPAEFMIRLLVLPAAITAALFPIFSRNFSIGEIVQSRILYQKSAKIIFCIMGFIAIGVCVGGEIGLKLWLGLEFAQQSSKIASVLAIGILFNSIAQIPHAYIQASGDARSTALIHLFESVLYLPLLLLLIQMEGILGAAIAWALRALTDLILMHAKAMSIRT